jgi:hypothetical protein
MKAAKFTEFSELVGHVNLLQAFKPIPKKEPKFGWKAEIWQAFGNQDTGFYFGLYSRVYGLLRVMACNESGDVACCHVDLINDLPAIMPRRLNKSGY